MCTVTIPFYQTTVLSLVRVKWRSAQMIELLVILRLSFGFYYLSDELFTNDKAISDNKSRERHGEGGSADSEDDCQAAEICDLTKGKPLHHRTANQAETARYCPIKVEDQTRLRRSNAETCETLREDKAETLLDWKHG